MLSHHLDAPRDVSQFHDTVLCYAFAVAVAWLGNLGLTLFYLERVLFSDLETLCVESLRSDGLRCDCRDMQATTNLFTGHLLREGKAV
jgi:hypothetical protein